MTTPFSSTISVRSLFRPKSFHSPSDCLEKGFNRINYSWSSAANYATIRHVAVKSSAKHVVVQHLLRKRGGVVRCATNEEIEAAKSSIQKDVKARMDKTIETVKMNFNSIRTGRSNPAMLDKVKVEYYGTPVGLKSIAQISTPNSASLLIQPFDNSSYHGKLKRCQRAPQKSSFDNLKAIEKAIVNSDLGMTPNNDGEVIRLSIPQLTTERRKEMSKVVAKQAEEGKVAVRNIRRDALKAYEKLEKDKKLSEDNVKDLSSDLQKLTDEYMKKIDSIFKQKEKELLTV